MEFNEQAYAELLGKYENLLNMFSDLVKIKENIEKDRDAIEKDRDAIKEAAGRMNWQNDELIIKLATTEEENKKLVSIVNAWEQVDNCDLEELRQENKELSNRIELLEDENQDLRRKVREIATAVGIVRLMANRPIGGAVVDNAIDTYGIVGESGDGDGGGDDGEDDGENGEDRSSARDENGENNTNA